MTSKVGKWLIKQGKTDYQASAGLALVAPPPVFLGVGVALQGVEASHYRGNGKTPFVLGRGSLSIHVCFTEFGGAGGASC